MFAQSAIAQLRTGEVRTWIAAAGHLNGEHPARRAGHTCSNVLLRYLIARLRDCAVARHMPFAALIGEDLSISRPRASELCAICNCAIAGGNGLAKPVWMSAAGCCCCQSYILVNSCAAFTLKFEQPINTALELGV